MNEVQQNKFAFFANFAESIRQLPEEIQPKAYQAICEFGIYGILPDDAMLRGMCLMAKASIQKVDGRSNNGGNHNPNGINQHNKEVKKVNSGQFGQSGQILSETETRNKKQETENKKDNLTVIQKKQNFQKPTFEEVEAYCRERNNGVDVARWFDYYTSNGWKVGKNAMKDWRAAVRTWERSSVAAPVSRKNTDDDEEYWAELARKCKEAGV